MKTIKAVIEISKEEGVDNVSSRVIFSAIHDRVAGEISDESMQEAHVVHAVYKEKLDAEYQRGKKEVMDRFLGKIEKFFS